MVLVVQAHVVREPVQRAVVRERLGQGRVRARVPRGVRLLAEDVVLGDEVARAGMERAREEGREDEVVERVRGAGPDQDVVERELSCDVEHVDGGEGHGVHEDGPDGVEENLEGAEEGLAKEGVEEDGFKGRREIRVEAVDT